MIYGSFTLKPAVRGLGICLAPVGPVGKRATAGND